MIACKTAAFAPIDNAKVAAALADGLQNHFDFVRVELVACPDCSQSA